jgi:hypothetical protein
MITYSYPNLKRIGTTEAVTLKHSDITGAFDISTSLIIGSSIIIKFFING